ncbi:phosphoheptose isomerase [Thiomicrorhabdus immobilis]|uniref:Phosphoheptose isomerase n=1 Tax=Thiomicrorhabdus immobilis TaxID=2791037 RepID=A0ABM7MBE6_9GAMM|nr:SIS domain-containing protein [Thiomicrorhabdus immobilis]BCN92681.1 phosphoheptose isomerase [Thiomicrorhabdus immobilis]
MSEMNIDFEHALAENQKAILSVIKQAGLVTEVVEKIQASVDAGGKVIWLGNGGSAADAQHMAAELMVRYVKNRQPIASIALTTDSSILTAHTNDYDFDSVFSRQIEGLARPGDVVIAMSTSGNSHNVVKAIQVAKTCGCVTVALTGKKDSAMSEQADYCLQVDSVETARIQEAHSFFNHLICEGLDTLYD